MAGRPAALGALGRRASGLRSPVADVVVDVVVVVRRRREEVGPAPLLALVVEQPGQEVSEIPKIEKVRISKHRIS